MSTSRRLRGVAAISAVILAAAGLAGSISATDECADEECPPTEDGSLDYLKPILEAYGCDLLTDNASLDLLKPMLETQSLDPETKDELEALYEQIDQICGGGEAAKVSDPGDDGDL